MELGEILSMNAVDLLILCVFATIIVLSLIRKRD